MERTKNDVTEMKNYILDQLRQRGCRITKQREVLIDVILREQCNNCKEIYYMAVKEDPDIGMATVRCDGATSTESANRRSSQ